MFWTFLIKWSLVVHEWLVDYGCRLWNVVFQIFLRFWGVFPWPLTKGWHGCHPSEFVMGACLLDRRSPLCGSGVLWQEWGFASYTHKLFSYHYIPTTKSMIIIIISFKIFTFWIHYENEKYIPFQIIKFIKKMSYTLNPSSTPPLLLLF